MGYRDEIVVGDAHLSQEFEGGSLMFLGTNLESSVIFCQEIDLETSVGFSRKSRTIKWANTSSIVQKDTHPKVLGTILIRTLFMHMRSSRPANNDCQTLGRTGMIIRLRNHQDSFVWEYMMFGINYLGCKCTTLSWGSLWDSWDFMGGHFTQSMGW